MLTVLRMQSTTCPAISFVVRPFERPPLSHLCLLELYLCFPRNPPSTFSPFDSLPFPTYTLLPQTVLSPVRSSS